MSQACTCVTVTTAGMHGSTLILSDRQVTHVRPLRQLRRAAYEQETRKIILSMDKVSKVSPSGKPILNGVGLGEQDT